MGARQAAPGVTAHSAAAAAWEDHLKVSNNNSSKVNLSSNKDGEDALGDSAAVETVSK